MTVTYLYVPALCIPPTQGVAWCDWIISNIEYKERAKRKGALELLIDTISKEAKKLDNKFIYALIKHQPLIDTYIKMGFIQGDSYSSEMIKII